MIRQTKLKEKASISKGEKFIISVIEIKVKIYHIFQIKIFFHFLLCKDKCSELYN